MKKPAVALLFSLLIVVLSPAACWQWGSPDFVFDERVTIQPQLTLTPVGTASAPTAIVQPSPSITSTRAPAIIEIDPPRIGQGGTAIVRVRGSDLQAATASFEGKPLPLVSVSGVGLAVIGVGPDHPTGDFPVVIRGTESTELIAVLTVTPTRWPLENIQVPPGQTNLLSAEAARQEEALRGPVLQTFTAERLWFGPFRLPVQAPLSDTFGTARSYNGGPVSSYHSGTDFDAEAGTPVMAAARGRVVFAAPLPIRGNSVIIDHGLGVLSGYHHLSEIAVAVGQQVNAGDVIGRVGATGLATGPHLHWEVIVRGVTVDPLVWTEREFGP